MKLKVTCNGFGGEELTWLILSAASKASLFDLMEIGKATPIKSAPLRLMPTGHPDWKKSLLKLTGKNYRAQLLGKSIVAAHW
ncbi:hypothetical protein GCM10008086_13190 [Salegentibacter mishustinae]|uniref:Uncharacterized protein n=1 Tax=Salegentibacter mishustinae TaxID=270918 RepID=A0A0Q9Z7V0_9FLAO|nr:hypothetical protein APR42_03660 [Salegentibacter mishustinae]PNW21913.1 hypothetical protein APB85_11830 [Salegentibacter mishustinae]GGW86239.1 hypothetical protein GCM10008086_13190 [Salegentibacter mishustinae]